ncbi:MAG: metallophosphoesterase [Eubacterium sp.]|nr:metallophosphoesterase [Eubacterium sp.]
MKYVFLTIAVLIIAIFLYYQNYKLDITNYKITSTDIENTLKIVHLSDLHSSSRKNVLESTRKLRPDLIMITGDFINDKCRHKDKMLDYGKNLAEIAPVYYITGNHERRLENFEEIMVDLCGIGFNVLLDEIAEVKINGSVINILGLDENQASFEAYAERKKGTFRYKDESPLLHELEEKKGFKIVLSHFPENFEIVEQMNYSKYDFDLQLSGHAHGGQFILPFIGPVLSPGQGLFPKYAKGSFGERPKLIVSRGIGNAEFPFRLFNHPEIVAIRLSKPLDKE